MPSSVARRAARQAARFAAEARRPAGRGREGWWSSQPAAPPRLKRASSTNPKGTGPAESPPLAAPPPLPPPPPPAAPPPRPTLPSRPPRPRAPLPRSDGRGCGGCGGCGGGGGGSGGGVLHGILNSGAGGFSSGPAAGPATGTGTATATIAATSDSRCAAAPSPAVSFATVSRARGLRRCSGHRNASGSSSLTLTPSSATAGMEVAATGGWSTLLGGEVGRCVEEAAGCSTTLRAMSSSVAARSADADAGQRGARGPRDMFAQVLYVSRSAFACQCLVAKVVY